MTRVTVDIPLNRVEGDLDIRVTFDNKRIVDAQCIGTLYRGFENMLTGRVAMDALVITPRICGICSITHLTAAVKAIEAAADITPPPQAVRMRNMSLLAETVQSDLRQVFLMFMADFAHEYYRDCGFHQEAVEYYAPLKGSGAIDALRASKDIIKVIAIIGGQWPHTSHMVPGGICTIPTLIDLTLVANRIEEVLSWYEKGVLGCSAGEFNETVTTADALFAHAERNPGTHLARFIRMCRESQLFEYGHSYPNYISYGIVNVPDNPHNAMIRGGVVLESTQFKPLDTNEIGEDLSHSWYRHTQVVQPPFEGTTVPDRSLETGYTWAKAPRYGDIPMQTGPLAQGLVDGEPLLTDLISDQGDTVFVRELARLIRPSRHLLHLRDQVNQSLRNFDGTAYIAPGPLGSGRGIGLTEAARGALGHWLEMEDGRIVRYQIVTPTAWNASPLDQKGQHGPWEQALIGLEIKDVDNPMEMGHVIRSFDPCLVCTVHALGDVGERTQWTLGIT